MAISGRRRRLIIVSARISDIQWHGALAADDEAQRWLGWRQEDMPTAAGLMIAQQPIRTREGVQPPLPHLLFFTAIDRRSLQIVGGFNIHRHEDHYRIGGMIRADHRHQGYGTEALRTTCAMAHKHFGIGTLIAGCEVANTIGNRWLKSSGLVPTDGPATHTLPNGRQIESRWWQSTHRRPRQRCRWLGEQRTELTTALIERQPITWQQPLREYLQQLGAYDTDTGRCQMCAEAMGTTTRPVTSTSRSHGASDVSFGEDPA